MTGISIVDEYGDWSIGVRRFLEEWYVENEGRL